MRKQNIIKRAAVAVMAGVMMIAGAIPAFAAGWIRNDTGWWYSTNDSNTAWHANGWQWIDGDGDGVSECYYFDQNGYMLVNATTPDGYTVNADGAWTVNGAVQTQAAKTDAATTTTTTTTAVATDALVPNGLYHDSGWNFYYRVETLADGTLCTYVSDASGYQGESHLKLTYIGDGKWTDKPTADFSDPMVATTATIATYNGESIHISLSGYVQLWLVRIGD